MSSNKKALHLMTWQEVDEAFKEDPVVLVPLGSMEEHGPHSITGDYLAATEIAKRVAENSDALYIPTIPFGNSEYFRGYPGTISLSQDTVLRILEDIFVSLMEHGITKIVVLNGHAGNGPAVDQVARKIRRDHKVMIASIDLWQTLSPEKKKEIYKEEDPSGHGGEPLTSVMSYLYPDKMRMDLLGDWEVQNKWQEFEVSNFKKVKLGDSSANIFFNMEEISERGVLGNPTNSSAERGKEIVDYLTEYGVELVKKVSKSNMKLK
ncbi:creatininase family protein [Salinibacillus xinjiangensis]|uniref:Creatininase family protein n=1 Tax=Salinibacillus xinjiangensis TaxID=1229268 RepID=A0A6G1X8D3_9BACI|nr:creatininase family protein [Salinibacillus xinjiangensis]MRG87263.1 creatininase family protein [Salinibacillus xinjiangensis]